MSMSDTFNISVSLRLNDGVVDFEIACFPLWATSEGGGDPIASPAPSPCIFQQRAAAASSV